VIGALSFYEIPSYCYLLGCLGWWGFVQLTPRLDLEMMIFELEKSNRGCLLTSRTRSKRPHAKPYFGRADIALSDRGVEHRSLVG
jgi:hypothetical protein